MPGRGEWINTIGEGEQENRKRAFAVPRAQTLDLERRVGSLHDWGGCIISGILWKGPPYLVVLQVQTQCIPLGLGEMTSFQESVIACILVQV